MVKPILWIILILLFTAISSPTNAYSGAWSVAAFSGHSVELIEINQAQPQEMAAEVEGHLKLTQDGGLQWRDSAIPKVARVIKYSPSHIGVIYAGTDAGLYLSKNGGYSWELIESQITSHKIVQALETTNTSVFAAMDDGVGTPQLIYKFDYDGGASLVNFPDSNAAVFTFDSSVIGYWPAQIKGFFVALMKVAAGFD
jgi:photosystem II stability/assembly factor-like uncharacterized protein